MHTAAGCKAAGGQSCVKKHLVVAMSLRNKTCPEQDSYSLCKFFKSKSLKRVFVS